MSGIIAGLAGAGGAANTAGGFYQGAMANDVNAAGSPAAADFIRLQNRALQPQFQAQDAQLQDSLAASGITNSGAARSYGGNLAAQQSAQIAGVDAPLYSQALQSYDAINQQMPGAQEGAYQGAIDQFYQAVESAASAAAGVPLGGGGGGFYDSSGNWQGGGIPQSPAYASTEQTAPSTPYYASGTPY